jgi:hypothetical protein
MSDAAEAYLKFANSVTRRKPSKLRVVTSEAQAPLVVRGVEKQIADNNAQMRRYQQARAQDQQGLLEGAHAEGAHALVTLLKALSPSSAPALLQLLEDFDWFKSASDHDRLTILGMIDDAIDPRADPRRPVADRRFAARRRSHRFSARDACTASRWHHTVDLGQRDTAQVQQQLDPAAVPLADHD